MKTLYTVLIVIIMTFACASLSYGQVLEGIFFIDKGTIDIQIENKSQNAVVLEGLSDRLCDAKFFTSDRKSIAFEIEKISNSKSFQEWTRLLAVSPDGANPGAIHRSIMNNIRISEDKKVQIAYMVFKVKVLTIEKDRRLSVPKEIEVQLARKS